MVVDSRVASVAAKRSRAFPGLGYARAIGALTAVGVFVLLPYSNRAGTFALGIRSALRREIAGGMLTR